MNVLALVLYHSNIKYFMMLYCQDNASFDWISIKRLRVVVFVCFHQVPRIKLAQSNYSFMWQKISNLLQL